MIRPADRERSALITGCEPQIFVTDVARSLVFYVEAPAYFAQVVRDCARLNLRHVDHHPIDAAARDREALLAVSMVVDDVAQLHLEFTAKGVVFAQGLIRQPWSAVDFVAVDPDGNLLLFAGVGRFESS